VLAQALLPFYSTKRSRGHRIGGCISPVKSAEAHGGRIQLANREGGGLERRAGFARGAPRAPDATCAVMMSGRSAVLLKFSAVGTIYLVPPWASGFRHGSLRPASPENRLCSSAAFRRLFRCRRNNSILTP